MTFSKTKMETLVKIFLWFSLCFLFSPANGDEKPSAYQVLQSYNLPIGVLPKGALEYTLDPNSGEFSVNLSSNCGFHAGSYKIKYSSPITGVISNNTLGDISGVKVKVSLFWISIETVKRNQDQLAFKIGDITTKHFKVGSFNSCPDCN